MKPFAATVSHKPLSGLAEYAAVIHGLADNRDHLLGVVPRGKKCKPVELEIKIKVNEHAPLRAALQACGGTRASHCLEINTFFDTDDRSLVAADKGLRLRVTHDVDHHTNATYLTYKGPRQPGLLRGREENEMTVGSADCTVLMLHALGFQQVISFEKKRESWKLGKCNVQLDELPHLGTYVEIEGPSNDAIDEVQAMLGLSAQVGVRASYAGLLMNYLQEQGSDERVVVFQKNPNAVAVKREELSVN